MLRKPLVIIGIVVVLYCLGWVFLFNCFLKGSESKVLESQGSVAQPMILIEDSKIYLSDDDSDSMESSFIDEESDSSDDFCDDFCDDSSVDDSGSFSDVDSSVEQQVPSSVDAGWLIQVPVDDFSMDSFYVPEVNSIDLYLLQNANLTDFTDDFLSLCATIHYEAGIAAPLESKIAVGHVVVNRLRDQAKWHYNTINDVIYADGQFSVIDLADFNLLKDCIRRGDWDENVISTIMAAYLVLTGSELYDIPDDVQFFYGDANKRQWGSLTYCFTVAGNSYFK